MSSNMLKKMDLDPYFDKRSSSNLSSSDVARIMAALGKKWRCLNHFNIYLKMFNSNSNFNFLIKVDNERKFHWFNVA